MRTTPIAIALTALALGFPACGDDGGAASDADSDADTDADTDADSDSDSDTDTGTGDGGTITIEIVNAAGAVRYFGWGISMPEHFPGSRVFECERSPDGGSSWQPCLVELPGCGLELCEDFEPGAECWTECEPSTLIKELQPGASVAIPWPVEVPAEVPGWCMADAGTCYEFGPAPAGLYRFSFTAATEIFCGPQPCEPDDEGFHADEVLTGDETTHSLEIAIPAASTAFEITLTE
jgi:hypothetical protein